MPDSKQMFGKSSGDTPDFFIIIFGWKRTIFAGYSYSCTKKSNSVLYLILNRLDFLEKYVKVDALKLFSDTNNEKNIHKRD